MDVGGVPGVRGVDVVRAGRRGAHQVGHRAQEHVVAGARPGLVRDQDVVGVERGVEEEVERRPALPLGDLVHGEGPVEVVRAVDVAGVPHVLVVLRVAGERERVVPPHRVADDLDERIHVGVVELPRQPRRRVRVAHQRPRHGRVEPAFDPVVELAPVERQEVRALLALDVDHLDELAGLHLVAPGRRPVDPEVQAGFGERGGELDLLRRSRPRPMHLDDEVARRGSAVDEPAGGGGHDEHALAIGAERLFGARRRPLAEQPDGHRTARVQPAAGEILHDLPGAVDHRGDERPNHGRGGVGPRADRLGRVRAVGGQHRELGHLAAVDVDHGEPVLGRDRQHRRAAGAHPVLLEGRIGRAEPSHQELRRAAADRHRV